MVNILSNEITVLNTFRVKLEYYRECSNYKNKTSTIFLYWDVFVNLCLNKMCSNNNNKEIFQFVPIFIKNNFKNLMNIQKHKANMCVLACGTNVYICKQVNELLKYFLNCITYENNILYISIYMRLKIYTLKKENIFKSYFFI